MDVIPPIGLSVSRLRACPRLTLYRVHLRMHIIYAQKHQAAAGLESEQGSARRVDHPPEQPHVGRSQIFVVALLSLPGAKCFNLHR